MRIALVSPLLAVGLTEFLTRGKSHREKRTAHPMGAAVGLVLALVSAPFVLPATTAAFLCSGLGSLAATLFHHLLRRRRRKTR